MREMKKEIFKNAIEGENKAKNDEKKKSIEKIIK